ncbi:MAG: XTP/dITP diphosphatase [Candidatus Hinthialibacter antarcticus]|nr:XTP/dITP diphosphatase [Candidatus Hinthialibacter antarcticus]
MSNTLLIATRNHKKQKELQSLLSGLGWDVVTLRDYPDSPDVEETGDTFLANAELKAVAASQHTGLLTLADDSGLAVDALDGRPGIYSARYANGEDSTDEENLQKVLDDIKGVPAEKRTARFVCAAVLAQGDQVVFSTEQCVEGFLTDAPSGEGGFGYDPIFYYPPFGKTFAEVPIEEKHAVSHRGQALAELIVFFETYSV